MTAAMTTPARITYMRASWVRTASRGSAPARMSPVIAPGRKTMPRAAVCSICGEIAVRRDERMMRAEARGTLMPRASPASIAARWSAVASDTRVAATTAAFIELPMTMPATGTSSRPVSSKMPKPKMMASALAATRTFARRVTARSPGTSGARRVIVTAAKTMMPATHSHDHRNRDAPVLQLDDAVGQSLHLREVVGDPDDGDAVIRELADEAFEDR